MIRSRRDGCRTTPSLSSTHRDARGGGDAARRGARRWLRRDQRLPRARRRDRRSRHRRDGRDGRELPHVSTASWGRWSAGASRRATSSRRCGGCSLRPACRSARSRSIDLEGKRAVVARHLDGHRTEVTWDHVVLSLGVADRTDAYPGLVEHAFRLREYRECFRLKNHIITMFEQAEIEEDPEERRRLLTFFVAGGGYAGTEVIGELSDFARRLTSREYPRVRYDECRFVLVHPGPTILPELYGDDGTGAKAHPKLVEFADQWMRKLGVEVRTRDARGVRDAQRGDAVQRRALPDAHDHQLGRDAAAAARRGARPAEGRARADRRRAHRPGRRPDGRLGRRRLLGVSDAARRRQPAGRALCLRARQAHRHATCAGRSSSAASRSRFASRASARAPRSATAAASPRSRGSRSPACCAGSSGARC